jgi:preprotein translocase subunit SecE
MAKTALVAEDRSKENRPENRPNPLVERTTTTYQQARNFLTDVRAEMRKVVTPSRKEVQTTTVVVLVTVFVFAFFFWAVDSIFTFGIDRLLVKLVGPQ